jgi:hypothetical protein
MGEGGGRNEKRRVKEGVRGEWGRGEGGRVKEGVRGEGKKGE